MTAIISQVDISTDRWTDAIAKLNLAIGFITNKAVSVNSNAAVGNAAIVGTFSSNVAYLQSINGGVIGAPAPLIISTATFTGNAKFDTLTVDLGVPANVKMTGANATHRSVSVNSATRSLYYETSRLDTTIQDVAVTTPANNQILTYNSTTSKWYNTDINTLTIDADTFGNYAPVMYPRKAEAANVTGSWIFSQPVATANIVQSAITTLASSKATVPMTTPTVIDSWPITNFNTVKYIICGKTATDVHSVEIMVIANSNTVHTTEYAQLFTNTQFLSYVANVSGTTVNLYAIGTLASNVSVQKTYIL